MLLDHLVYIDVLLELMLSMIIMIHQLERQSMWDYITMEEVYSGVRLASVPRPSPLRVIVRVFKSRSGKAWDETSREG